MRATLDVMSPAAKEAPSYHLGALSFSNRARLTHISTLTPESQELLRNLYTQPLHLPLLKRANLPLLLHGEIHRGLEHNKQDLHWPATEGRRRANRRLSQQPDRRGRRGERAVLNDRG